MCLELVFAKQGQAHYNFFIIIIESRDLGPRSASAVW